MNHTIPEESVIVDGEVYARHVAINQNYYHPTGEYIPLSADDKQQTLLHRWSRIVRRFAMSPALEEGDRRVSYAAFNTLANRIAHAILARRVPKDLPVAAIFDIESDLQIGLFAIWKAGNFFVWLEPEEPLARIQSIVEDCGALVVVTNQKYALLARQLWPGEGQVIVIEELPTNLPGLDPPVTIDASSPAYLVYDSGSTGGSTGKPKGTVELHRNLVAMLAVHESIFHFSTHDRVAYMDHGSGWSYAAAAALMYGGTSLAFNWQKEGLEHLLHWSRVNGVTVLLGDPVVGLFLSSFDGSEEIPTLRVISGGAEPLDLKQMVAYQKYMPDSCVLANSYSATECRSITLLIMDKKSRFEGPILPVGFPTRDVELEIWDDRDRPVRVGETGEIIAITPYAAEGYWKSPELTANRFGVDWQHRRYFRTGDLGRLDEQGCLWILERKGDQFNEEPIVEEAVESPEVAGIVGIIAGPETSESIQAPTSLGVVDDLALLSTFAIAQSLDVLATPEVEESPAEIEAPAVTAKQETLESVEFDEPLETQESDEAAETPEQSEPLETTNILVAVATLKTIEDVEVTEIPEGSASVEIDASVEAAAELELTEIADAPEIPAVETLELSELSEVVKTLVIVASLDAAVTHLLPENAGLTEISESVEILETPGSFEAVKDSTKPELLEPVENLEAVETVELQESVNAPESLDLSEISGPIEVPDVAAAVEMAENLDLTEESQSSQTLDVAESLDTPASVEFSEIPEGSEIPETVESFAPQIAVDEIVDESIDAAIVLGMTEVPERAEHSEAAEALAALAILGLTETPEPEKIPKSEVEAPPETAETVDLEGSVDAPESLDLPEESQPIETPVVAESPETLANVELSEIPEESEIPKTAESLAPEIVDEIVDAAIVLGVATVPDRNEFPEMAVGLAALAMLGLTEASEPAESFEPTNIVESLTFQQKTASLELTEIPEATEAAELAESLEAPESLGVTETVAAVESLESSQALEIASTLETEETLEAAGSDMIEEVAAPWTLETSEIPEATLEAETVEALELTESPETTASLEADEIFDEPEGLTVAAIAALTVMPEVTEFPEMREEFDTLASLESTESAENSETPEVEETPVAPEMLDVVEKQEPTENSELTEIPEAIETPETPVNVGVAENREMSDVLKAAAILGLIATPERVETPVTAETVEAPVTLEPIEIPATSEVPEAVETLDDGESLDTTEIPEEVATPEMADATEVAENLELSDVAEASVIPAVVVSQHAAEGLDATDILAGIVAWGAIKNVGSSPTREADEILEVAATTQAVESLEVPTTLETGEDLQAVEALQATDTPAMIAPVVEQPIAPLFIATKAYEQYVKLGEQHQAYHTGEYVPMSAGEMQLTLLHRWEQMVERFGANAALEELGRTLTYAEFNSQANRIAHAILSRHVAKDVPVALLVDVEGDLPIGMIAIWKAGNFYVWLEADQPLAANRSIVEDCGATVVVTNRKYETMARQLWPNEGAVIVAEDLASQPAFNPPITINGESPAYLMYSSGSTGKPTGVLDLHRNFVHMLAVRQDIFRYSTDERIAFMARPGGSRSAVPAIVGAALMYGGCLLPFNPVMEGIVRSNQWLIERRITTLSNGPFIRSWLLTLDGRQKFPALRRLMGGGGPTYREHIEAYQRFLPDSCLLIDTYSATEVRSVTIMIADKSTRVGTRLVAAGILLPPATVEIWDERDRRLSVGEVGEIVVFSPFIAQGYWNSPELTASRFGVNAQGRRYYRMGDLGRLDEQGQLWVLGRVDGQLKIRGYRVEPAEIEVAMLELPNVKEVAVIHVAEASESGESRKLVAYVGSTAKITGPDLRKRLETLMPAFIVPATIVVLEQLPRNANGKVNRTLLQEMQGGVILPRASVTEQPVTASEDENQPETITQVAAVKIAAPKVDMVLPKESVVVSGVTFVQHVKLGQQNDHPTGEHVPITPAEQEKTLLHRFGRMVERFYDNPAIEEGKRVLSYVEFNALANRIAHALIGRKLSPEKPVAVLCDLESDLYIGTFAVWKAGLFFVWIEPQEALARNQSIVEDCGATVVITNRKHADLARQLFSDPTGIYVAEEMTSGYPSYDPDITLQPSSPAFLMYSSDSTGKPKGVLELHRNLMETFVVHQSFLHFSNQERVVHLSPASGWAFAPCAALMYGGCVLPYQAHDQGLASLSQWLIDRGITIASGGAILRPWLLSLDGSQQFPNLRLVCLDAGASYQQHMQAYQRHLSDRCLLLISYSATECQTITLLVIDKSCEIPSRLLPAGFPTAHVAIEIWDALKRPLAVGETGEVVVFTAFAAQGYWNALELTKSQFGVDAKGRHYVHTGDLGRMDENGALWVVGRKDRQVKIGGNRVDMAEVEVALMDVPNVKEVALIYSGASDETRVLTAYVTTFTSTPGPATGDEVRKEVETRLPSYMVPATLLVLEEFPRSANGEIERSMLQDVAAGGGKKTIEKPAGAAAPALPTETKPSVDQALKTQKQAPSSLPGHYKIDARINAVQVMPGTAGNRPIFFCPGGNGSLTVVMRDQELLGRLDNKRPLYGLVAADNDVANGLYKNIDELVAASLFAMRRIQPRGPYTLIGEDLGGKLAYEMARLLVKEGERVALLALLDAPFRGGGRQDGSDRGNWLQRLFKRPPGKSGGQEAQSKKNRAHLAQRRYLRILRRFEPSKSYPLPTLALFTHQYEGHRPRWEKVLPAIKVTMVDGVHDDYLRVSGDKVVGLLRQAMDGTPAPQKKAVKFGRR